MSVYILYVTKVTHMINQHVNTLLPF